MALRKASDPRPQISQVTPPAAIAGGEFQIRGKGFVKSERPRVTIGEVAAPIVIGSDSFIIAKVPDGATAGEMVIENGEQSSESWACDIGVLIADSLHPVTSPAVDSFGNIFTTFSGSRGPPHITGQRRNTMVYSENVGPGHRSSSTTVP